MWTTILQYFWNQQLPKSYVNFIDNKFMLVHQLLRQMSNSCGKLIVQYFHSDQIL